MTLASIADELAIFYYRNGYVRRADPKRLTGPRTELYKKGSEVRLTAESYKEMLAIRRLLKAAGFKPGKTFRKGGQYRIPLYGHDQVDTFLRFVRERY